MPRSVGLRMEGRSVLNCWSGSSACICIAFYCQLFCACIITLVFYPYSCSYLRWTTLLGTLERCVCFYWYYFVLVLWYDPCLLLQLPSGWTNSWNTRKVHVFVLILFVLVLRWPLSSIAATFMLNQTSWNTWKVHVFALISFCACIVIWPLSSIAATFRLNQTSWNTWKVHVFALISFCACIVIWPLSSIAATFRLNQTSRNTWKVHVFVLLCCCRVSYMTFPLLILSLNKSDRAVWMAYTLTVTTGYSKQSIDNLVEHSHSFRTGCACCRWLIVLELCLPLYMTFPLPLFLTCISFNKTGLTKGKQCGWPVESWILIPSNSWQWNNWV